MRDKFIIFLFVLVMSLPSLSVAAPIEFQGECYAEDAQVVEEWQQRLPVVDAVGNFMLYTVYPYTASTPGSNLYVPYSVRIGAGATAYYATTFKPCAAGVVGKGRRQFSSDSLLIAAVGVIIALVSFNFSKWRH